MTKFRALIFDCDGVIAETESDGHRVAFNTVFIEENLGKRIEQYDTTDKTQKRFVSLQCKSARNLIENLIEAELDKSL